MSESDSNPAGELCPICRERPADLEARPDTQGQHWCAECVDEFDSIDWEAVYEARQEYLP